MKYRPVSVGMFDFVTNCVGSDYESIQALTASEKPISLAMFRARIGPAQWKELQAKLGYDRSFPISKDWHVGYYSGTYRGVPCVFLRHSRIEWIFTHRNYGVLSRQPTPVPDEVRKETP